LKRGKYERKKGEVSGSISTGDPRPPLPGISRGKIKKGKIGEGPAGLPIENGGGVRKRGCTRTSVPGTEAASISGGESYVVREKRM